MVSSFSFCKARSRAIIAGVCSIAFVTSLSAQVTSVKLPTADSSASFQVRDSGNVVKLRVNGDGGFVARGRYGTGVIPMEGEGARMMWYPAKAAFRVGSSAVLLWDDPYIGQYSVAMGSSTMASGYSSTAMGSGTIASGNYSTAMGYHDTASGQSSTAMGQFTLASGAYSTAMGYFTKASGGWGTAMGYTTQASGAMSTTMGNSTIASGINSTVMGFSTVANGNYSTAMGSYVQTSSFTGSFIIGDSSRTFLTSTAANQMTMRFGGGYRLYTTSAAIIGAQLEAGAASWSALSDSTKKTGFVKADHDYFLSRLAKLRLGSWNYKSQDAKHYRHYGPMAQEIFHYFGKDGKGTIGCDTLLATADMDGIMMICLQALEKRTGELGKGSEKIAAMEKQNAERDGTIAALAEKVEKLSMAMSNPSIKNSKQLSFNISHEEAR